MVYLESNLALSSGDRKYKYQFLSRKCHAPSNQVSIDKLVDQHCYSLLLAIRLCLQYRISLVCEFTKNRFTKIFR